MNNPDNGIHTHGEKEVYYHGVRFVRDEKTGYYLNSTNRMRLHRYVWIQNNTLIPKGYEIHHLNGDKNDNTVANLRLVLGLEHRQLHGKILTGKQREYLCARKEKAILKATEWHRSEEGRKWHHEHAKKMWHEWHQRNKECECIVCHRKFFATKRAKICSANCKTKFRRLQGLLDETRTCVICGKEYVTNKYGHTRTCSIRCKAQYRLNTMGLKRKKSMADIT